MIVLCSSHRDIPYCREIISEATATTGIPAKWEEASMQALADGDVLLCWYDSEVVGFVGFTECVLPDTTERVVVERFLYVAEIFRGREYNVAGKLLEALELVGRFRKVDAILAGSSLHSNAHARRLYERHGFKTNYTFRKEL